MRKDYKIFNEIKNNLNEEEIKLSVDDKKEMKDRALRKIKKNNNGSKNKKRVLVGIAACTMFIVLAFNNNSVIAKVSEVGRSIEKFFEKEENSLKKYKENVLIEKEDKGIKLIVNEAIYNDRKILVSTTIDYSSMNKDLISKKGKYTVENYGIAKIEIFSNGEKVEINGVGSRGEDNEDGTMDVLLNASGWTGKLADEIEVKIGIDTMEIRYANGDSELINGDWNVKFNLSTESIKNSTKVIEINKGLSLDYGKDILNVKVEELRITPLSMRLELTGATRCGFEFYDENGKEIEFISEGASDERFYYEWIIDRDIKKIKVVPTTINGLNIKKKFEELSFEIELKN